MSVASDRISGPFDLVRPNRLCDRLVFADGIGSSGKGMLSHLLASLIGVEKQSNHTPFDFIAYLYHLGKIEHDAAVTYLQTEADQQLYHIMMSRDVNFRPKDSTGVLQNPRPFEYVKRLFAAEGDAVVERVRRERPILNEAPHDALRNGRLFFDAFGDGLRIVYVVRNPYELILDWARRGFGDRIGTDPREFQFSVRRGGVTVPMFMLDYEFDAEYVGLNTTERILLMIAYCFRHNLAGYEALAPSQREHVYILHFDELLVRPADTIQRIAGFLGVQTTGWTRKVIARERLPRPLPSRDDMQARVVRECRTGVLDAASDLNQAYDVLRGHARNAI